MNLLFGRYNKWISLIYLKEEVIRLKCTAIQKKSKSCCLLYSINSTRELIKISNEKLFKINQPDKILKIFKKQLPCKFKNLRNFKSKYQEIIIRMYWTGF